VDHDIGATLRRFVNENFLFQHAESPLPDDVSFRECGIIDSTGVIELVCFLEETFGIKVGEDEMYPENLDSIRALAAYVSRKADSRELPRAA
jgi:acyl carrier protein